MVLVYFRWLLKKKGWFDSTSFAEGGCEGSWVRFLVICSWCNSAAITLCRHMAPAARRLNAGAENPSRCVIFWLPG
jgi:hypothetical protein